MGVMSFSFCCFFSFPCVYCVHRGTLRFLMIFAVYLSKKLKKKGREGGWCNNDGCSPNQISNSDGWTKYNASHGGLKEEKQTFRFVHGKGARKEG